MRGLEVITLILVIIGGIVWGLIGLFSWNLVSVIFDGWAPWLSRIIYIVVGLSALYQLMPLSRKMSG